MSASERFDSFLSDGLEASGSDLEGYDEVVSGLAGALYSELERLIGAHGEGAVTGLMPLAVSALETLEAVCAESRERGSEAALGRQENERLLAQFERERAKRKRTEEKFLELDDSLEHERKTQKSQLEQSASQTRQMEVKAKSYLDMMLQLEEEKASLEKDHKKLLQNYNVILRSLKDLQVQYRLQQSEGARHSGSSTPRINRDKRAFPTEFSDGSSSLTSDLDQGYPESYSASEEPVTPAAADVVAPHPVEELPSQGLADGAPTLRLDRELETGGTRRPEKLSEIEDIIQTTPELQLSAVVPECPSTSTPRHSEDEGVERNTDSILQELQSMGSELIEELDGGADLLDLGCHVESFVSENAELREKQAAMESARRSLIARVEELACEREELRHQLGDALEARRAMESKIKELETAVKRAKHEAEEKLRGESDDTEVSAAQRRRFTRAEMSRVITERNLYKERLMELQEAVRRSERMRALKEQRIPQTKKSTIWDRFNRLLGLSSVPARHDAISWVPTGPVHPVPHVDSAPHLRRSSVKSLGSDDGSETQTAKGQRSEQYRLIRTYVWQEHGRSQLHGWSLPNKESGERPRGGESTAGPFPALVQVRLLDQKDPSTKLWCAAGVQLCEQDLANLQQMAADNTAERGAKDLVPPLSTVWICSGTPSETEVMVIDAGKANHVLDHFSIASCHILCSASVPAFHDSDYAPLGSAPSSLSGSLASLESVGSDGAVPLERASDWVRNGSERDTGHCAAQSGTEDDGDSISDQSQCSRESVTAGSEDDGPGTHCRSSALPTVWLGSQSGRLFVHSACSHWRRCLHSIRLEDCVHSIVYTRGYVVATLGNGTLAIFHRNSDGTWDVTGRRALDLGRPCQNVRCATPVADKVWCGYRNRIYVINPRAAKIEKWFEVTPRVESQVRHLACLGQGVWVSVRLESTLRLFHARSGQPLQEVDIQPFVSAMFGSGPLGLSFLQVTAMSVFCKRLWIGTGTGIVVSLPLSAEPEAGTALKIANGSPAGQEEQLQGAGPAASIPYCLLSLAQICFHGHRDAVRFFVAASINVGIGGLGEGSSNSETQDLPSYLVMSGGEGYINFRIGDDTGEGEQLRGTPTLRKSERSHLIVWQMKT